ncbi:MAG: recombinase RecA [Planctomycetota bacterium]|jgi:recombination protein RecA|nr:recombinase RecA [Planctomycetota bacterium]
MAKAKNKDEVKEDAGGKMKALGHTLDEIGKRFGNEAIRKLGSDYKVECEVISTGSLALDAAIGVGGVPRGRIIEFYGPESSGKTTLALQVLANAQKSGGVGAFIDAEHALDPLYARRLGVNLDELLVSQPDSGEQALDIAELLTRSGAVDVIVIDSVAALTPQAELDGEMGDSHMGLQARLMSQGLRKLTGICKKSNTTILFINQIRMKIGVMFGNPETTTGGNALKFYASLRLDIRRVGAVKKGEETIGNQVKVKVVKNKVAPPFRTANFDIMFNKGINATGELIDLGAEHNILGKSGSWINYGDTRIGQGRDNAMAYLDSHPEMRAEINQKLRDKLLNGDVGFDDLAAPDAEEENGEDN